MMGLTKGEKAEFLIAQIARIAQIVNDCSVIAIDCQWLLMIAFGFFTAE